MEEILDVGAVDLLQNLDTGMLELARALVCPCRFEAGETIIHQGDDPESVFLLFAGEVEVVQHVGGRERHRIAEFGPGALFGERALLTGEKRTADVVARTAVHGAEISRNNFSRLLRLHPQIYDNLCRILARQLGNWSLRHQREERENRELLHNLIGWQNLPEFDSFPGVSRWARLLNLRLQQLADSTHNVLIIGERGTWKELAARLIHFHNGDRERPILYLDCTDPPPVLRRQDGQRSPVQDELTLAIAQESALFGHEPDSRVYAEGTRRGFLELAAGGELILENVEFLAQGVQRRLADYLRYYHFSRRGESEQLHSRVRIIATSDEDVRRLALENRFNPDLCNGLGREIVELLPLRERDKDIPVIAKRLMLHLNQKHHKQLRGLSQEAINLLVDYDWPLNGQELQQVIDRAVAVAQGPRLLAEHIFLNITPPSAEGRVNLLQLPLVRRLFQHAHFPGVLQVLTLPVFGAILIGCFVPGAWSDKANALVWACWWPALLASILLASRSWCSFCPLSGIARLLAALPFGAGGEPSWLRREGGWLGLGGLLLILLVEQKYDLFHHPRATGLLLCALLGLTLGCSLLFGLRSWCRHLCPLGRMVGFCARTSLLELRSNDRICHSQCRIDDCIRNQACPMGLHPTAAGATDDCILCGSCVRHCPHNAISLNLRYPWLGLGERPEGSWAMTIFAPAVLLILPWQVASSPIRFWWLASAILALLVLVLSDNGGRRRDRLKSLGCALLPLAIAALFIFFFHQSLVEGPALLQPLLQTFSGRSAVAPLDLRILALVPALVAAGASYLSWRIYRHRSGRRVTLMQKAAALVVLLVYLGCFGRGY